MEWKRGTHPPWVSPSLSKYGSNNSTFTSILRSKGANILRVFSKMIYQGPMNHLLMEDYAKACNWCSLKLFYVTHNRTYGIYTYILSVFSSDGLSTKGIFAYFWRSSPINTEKRRIINKLDFFLPHSESRKWKGLCLQWRSLFCSLTWDPAVEAGIVPRLRSSAKSWAYHRGRRQGQGGGHAAHSCNSAHLAWVLSSLTARPKKKKLESLGMQVK